MPREHRARSNGSVDGRIRLLAAGFPMHVPKPVEPAELVMVVARLAGRTARRPSPAESGD